MEALRASLEKKAAAPSKAREPQAEARKAPKRAQELAPAPAAPRRRRRASVSKPRLKPQSSALMHPYGVGDVEKLLGLPRSTIRALIAAEFVSPARGPRNAWLFSFQDLIVLRTAQALADAKVPQRRITKSLRELRRHLPEAHAALGLEHLRGGRPRRHPRARQSLAGRVRAVPARVRGRSRRRLLERDRKKTVSEAPSGAAEWFDRAVALEPENREAALRAYQQAIAADPAFVNAHINLGRLLHEARRYAEGRAGLSRGDENLRQRTRCCSTTWACCSTTWIAGRRRWSVRGGARRRSRAWPNATTTWRCCAKSSRSRRTRSGTWRGIAH